MLSCFCGITWKNDEEKLLGMIDNMQKYSSMLLLRAASGSTLDSGRVTAIRFPALYRR